jgi:hypothetical protein
MRLTYVVVALALAGGCKKKQNTGETTGSGSADMAGSGSATMATGTGSAAMAGSDSAAMAAGSGSAAMAAGSGSATADGSGAVVALDPKYAKLDAQERHTCAAYSGCMVERAKDDDPKAGDKENAWLNACLDVWTGMKKPAQAKLTKCADAAGACDGVLPCFKDLAIKQP